MNKKDADERKGTTANGHGSGIDVILLDSVSQFAYIQFTVIVVVHSLTKALSARIDEAIIGNLVANVNDVIVQNALNWCHRYMFFAGLITAKNVTLRFESSTEWNGFSGFDTSSRSSRSRRRRYSPLNALDERFSGASSQGAESMCISPANSNSPGNAEILQRKGEGYLDSEAASSSKTPSLANLQPSTGHGIHSQFCGMTAATSTATFSCNSGPSSSTNFRDTKEKSAAQSWGRTSLESNSSPTSKKSGAENLSSTKVQAWRDAIINRCYTDISEELSVAIRGDLVRLILDFALSSFSSWKKSAPRKEASTQPDATPKHQCNLFTNHKKAKRSTRLTKLEEN
ncbi:hypothetical protein M513_12533 [Trichuris suis]|uniref:Uncharacterized protein n=1 Tax=Trichuris suis TaxID=68888 RepID=A0A085LNQ3_9BILA|nr:hypothetical protein M513_12533 [Trichuris suis]